MITYTIDRLLKKEDFTKDIFEFAKIEVPKINKRFNNAINHNNVNMLFFAEHGVFLIGRRNGEMRGFVLAMFVQSPFDHETKILQQVLLYVKPDSGRTAFHLFKKFIDIGKTEANHIITMITSQTNIKPRSLEKMGFKELETLYRMEV